MEVKTGRIKRGLIRTRRGDINEYYIMFIWTRKWRDHTITITTPRLVGNGYCFLIPSISLTNTMRDVINKDIRRRYKSWKLELFFLRWSLTLLDYRSYPNPDQDANTQG